MAPSLAPSLVARIESREAVVGVIGLGYVGLTIATALAAAGFRVIGVEKKAERVALIQAGTCPIRGVEPELPQLLAEVTSRQRLVAVTEIAALAEADIVLIDVETPVEADHRPRFEALRAACQQLGAVMKPGALVVVESTLAPGTTESLVAPLLAEASQRVAHEGFFIGHCPQRVMPGKLLENLRAQPRVCGGDTPETTQAMMALYATVVQAPIDPADCLTAELVKTAENTYRDVKIAFANELALICESVGADVRRVQELVNRAGARDLLTSGAGVGGHCIPKDPWLLTHGSSVEPRVVAAARDVNDRMPAHVATLIEEALVEAGLGVWGARILVLGYAYLENSGDTRNSPSEALVTRLAERGIETVVHDPWVAEHAGDLWEHAATASAAVIMVAHAEYRELDLARLARTLRAPVLIDARHVVETDAAQRAGLVFRAVGRGRPAPKA